MTRSRPLGPTRGAGIPCWGQRTCKLGYDATDMGFAWPVGGLNAPRVGVERGATPRTRCEVGP